MLHLETHAFPDALLCPEMHAFPDARVNLISIRPSRFASPPTATTAAAAATTVAHVSVADSHCFCLCLHQRCLHLQVRRHQQKTVAVGTMVKLLLVLGQGRPAKV
jgi:hypothetical protein